MNKKDDVNGGQVVSEDLLYIHREKNDGRDVQVLKRDGRLFIGITHEGELEKVELTESEAEQLKEALDDAY